MKFIVFRQFDAFDTRAVIETVAGHAGERGVKADEMRRRVRILDALERARGSGLTLEDADHDLLARLVNEFPFTVANPNLLRIIDDVVEAKPPPPADT